MYRFDIEFNPVIEGKECHLELVYTNNKTFIFKTTVTTYTIQTTFMLVAHAACCTCCISCTCCFFILSPLLFV